MEKCSCHSKPEREAVSGEKGYIWPSDTFTHRRAYHLLCGHIYIFRQKQWRLYYLGMAERFNPKERGIDNATRAKSLPKTAQDKIS